MTGDRLTKTPEGVSLEGGANPERRMSQERRNEAAVRSIHEMSNEEITDVARCFTNGRNEGIHDPDALDEAFIEGLFRYPSAYPERAKEIYTKLANSSSDEDRELIGYVVDGLATVDHDAGIRLWSQLVQDVEPKVRKSAFNKLDGLLHESISMSDEGEIDEHFDTVGLTHDDALRLRFLRERAENGYTHNPRTASYERFADLIAREEQGKSDTSDEPPSSSESFDN